MRACRFSTVRKCKELVQAVVVSCCIIGLYFMCLNRSNNKEDYDFKAAGSQSFRSSAGNDIFFLETSGEDCLTPYQACSIESARKANPRGQILIYMEEKRPSISSPGAENFKDVLSRRSCSITKSLFKSDRIQVVKENLFAYLKGTPLQKFVHDGNQIRIQHKSDMVRAALLWKKGGIYLDHDVIVLRPLIGLKNTVGMANGPEAWGTPFVESTILSFQAGHPLLHDFMEKMTKAYDPSNYMCVSADSLAKSLLDFCDLEGSDGDSLDPNTGGTFLCRNDSFVRLEPYDAFYAFDNKERESFFEAHFDKDKVGRSLKRSYLSHIYGVHRHSKAPDGSLYHWLATQFCPNVHNMTIEEFGEF